MKKLIKEFLEFLGGSITDNVGYKKQQDLYTKGESFERLAKPSENESSRGERAGSLSLLPKAILSHGQTEFEVRNPQFDEDKFKEKVEIAFFSLLKAMEEGSLAEVNRFISHAVSKRYETLFEMMRDLDLKYKFRLPKILDMAINEYEVEEDYDIIHIGIMAKVEVKYLSNSFPHLNYSDSEYFIEYWSFIRKRGSLDGDIYTNHNCPKCGSELPLEQGELLKCSYCHTLITSAEYDWILAEVTQEEDYIFNRSAKRNFSIDNKIDKLSRINSDFSVQMLEDKVSNGYIQILNALAYDKLKTIKRFISEDLYIKLREKEMGYLYSKLYLNHVTLIDLFEVDGYNYIDIKVKSSFQRVKVEEGDLIILDDYLCKRIEVIRVMRKQNNFVAKGELYSHTCPSCGGQLSDTDNVTCPYCRNQLANPDHEWIILDIIPWLQYSIEKKGRI